MFKRKTTNKITGQFVRIEEVEPDYDQDAGYRVTIHENDSMPPHTSWFFTDRADAVSFFNRVAGK
jgi:hypothetical protein